MAQYRIGNTSFEADDLVAAIAHVKANGLTGKMVRVKGSVEAAPIQTKNDRIVTTTCGWGKAAHKWEGLLSDVIAHKNTCPQHRS